MRLERTIIQVCSTVCITEVLLAAVACTSGTSDPAAITETVADDGVLEVVSHAPEPLPAPWVLEQELVIGVEYGAEEYMLRNPRNFIVLEDGEIIIADANPLQIRIYDSQGTHIKAFGREGEGPTDLRGFVRLHDIGNGLFQTWGGFRPFTVKTWDLEGVLHGAIQLRDTHPFYTRSVYHWDGTLLFTQVSDFDPSPERRWSYSHLVTSDLEGVELDTIATIDHSEMTTGVGMAQAVMDVPPVDLRLITSEGRFYYSALEEDWIREVDLSTGGEIRRFRWIHEPDSLPEDPIGELPPYFPESERKEIAEGVKWLVDRITAFSMAEGPGGEIWVQRTAYTDESGLRAVDIFSGEGRYRGRLMVNFDTWRMRVAGDDLYYLGTSGEAPALIRCRIREAR